MVIDGSFISVPTTAGYLAPGQSDVSVNGYITTSYERGDDDHAANGQHGQKVHHYGCLPANRPQQNGAVPRSGHSEKRRDDADGDYSRFELVYRGV